MYEKYCLSNNLTLFVFLKVEIDTKYAEYAIYWSICLSINTNISDKLYLRFV